jgi:hypothetical protein
LKEGKRAAQNTEVRILYFTFYDCETTTTKKSKRVDEDHNHQLLEPIDVLLPGGQVLRITVFISETLLFFFSLSLSFVHRVDEDISLFLLIYSDVPFSLQRSESGLRRQSLNM